MSRPATIESADTSPKVSWWFCAYLIALLLFLWYYLGLSQTFAFDLAFDMDISSVNDALLFNSGQLPVHIDHPRYLMHLITAWSVQIGHWLGWVSVAQFSELAQSPSPLLPIAELTLFLRGVEACVVWLTLVVVSALLWRLHPRQRLLHFGALLLLGWQQGLMFCAMVLRTEVYSILFLFLGLLQMQLLLEQAERRGRRGLEVLAWLLAGLCCGIAVLTKLQAILALPFFLACVAYFYSLRRLPDVEAQTGPRADRKLYLASGLALLGVLIPWLLMLRPAWFSVSPAGIGRPFMIPLADFAAGKLDGAGLLPHLKLQLVWIGLLASMLLSVILAAIGPLLRYRRALSLYLCFSIGLLGAFWLPLLAYLGPAVSQGWPYFLQITKAVIWTDLAVGSTRESGQFVETLAFVLASAKNYLLLALAGLALLLLQWRQLPRRTLICLGLCFAGVLVILLGSRAIMRDTIWFELLGSFCILLLIERLWSGLASRRGLQALILSCLALPMIGQAWMRMQTIDQIYLNYAPFLSSQYSVIAHAVFSPSDADYPEIMRSAYELRDPLQNADSDRLRKAMAQARLLPVLRKLADRPFLDRHVPVKALGLAEPGFAAWRAGPRWARFKRFAPELAGSLLIDPLQLTGKQPAWNWLAMSEQLPLSQRWLHASSGERLSIFSTREVQLLFCLAREDYHRLGFIGDEAAPLQLSLGDETLDYLVIQISARGDSDIHRLISGYTEFSQDWLRRFQRPPFFLVRQGNGWGQVYPLWENLKEILSEDPAASAAP